jgi:hypothetical protein
VLLVRKIYFSLLSFGLLERRLGLFERLLSSRLSRRLLGLLLLRDLRRRRRDGDLDLDLDRERSRRGRLWWRRESLLSGGESDAIELDLKREKKKITL